MSAQVPNISARFPNMRARVQNMSARLIINMSVRVQNTSARVIHMSARVPNMSARTPNMSARVLNMSARVPNIYLVARIFGLEEMSFFGPSRLARANGTSVARSRPRVGQRTLALIESYKESRLIHRIHLQYLSYTRRIGLVSESSTEVGKESKKGAGDHRP